MELNTQSAHELAILLVTEERSNRSSLIDLQNDTQRVFNKIHIQLSHRIGIGGYQAILNRSVKLAAVEFAWLSRVTVDPDGTLQRFARTDGGQTEEDSVEAAVAILANLIEVLETLIGRNLCVRVLHDVWPVIDSGEQARSKDEINE